MKIRSVETFILKDKLEKSFYFSQWHYSERKICLVKVTTEDGTIGWGEGYGPADVLNSGVKFLEQFVVGMNPIENEKIWYTMYRRTLDYARSGILMAAVSAIDVAIWDLKGKILGLPVHALMGGKQRDEIFPYATGLYFREEKDLVKALTDEAIEYKALGYKAVKMKVGMTVKDDIEMVKAVREGIGDDMRLMIDANHAYTLLEAKELTRAIEQYNISWFEEPLSPEFYEQHAELRNATTIPLSGGECEYLRYGFNRLIQNKSVDILQPDICASGGLTEAKRIATLASTNGLALVPHSWGTYIAISAAVHFIANLEAIPGRLIMPEYTMEHDRTSNGLRDDVTMPAFDVVDGKLTVPDTPGLGVEINEDALLKYTS